jgi:uncharacterized protein (TIGR03437 family)
MLTSNPIQLVVTPLVAPVLSFTADRSTVEPSGSVVLSWSATGATTSVGIDNNIGQVSVSGTRSVTLTATTTFTATAIGPGGTSKASVTITVPTTPYFKGAWVVDNASGQNSCSPGGICSIYGFYLAVTAAQNTDPKGLPLALAGNQVLINGKAAPLFYVSPSQINFLMTMEATTPTASMQVVSNSLSSGVVGIPVAPVGPGIYQSSGMMIAQDVNYQVVGTPANPVVAGSAIVMYVTGLGQTDCGLGTGQFAPGDRLCQVQVPVTVSFGGVAGQVLFAGLAPGFAGLYQIDVFVPGGLSSGGGDPANSFLISVVVKAGGKEATSQTLYRTIGH